jgi:hypothetical protein
MKKVTKEKLMKKKDNYKYTRGLQMNPLFFVVQL